MHAELFGHDAAGLMDLHMNRWPAYGPFQFDWIVSCKLGAERREGALVTMFPGSQRARVLAVDHQDAPNASGNGETPRTP